MIYPAVAIVIFLIIILILLKIRRKKLSSETKPDIQESKPVNKVASTVEPVLQAKETSESLATVQQESKTVINTASSVEPALQVKETSESLSPVQQESKTVANTVVEPESKPVSTQIPPTPKALTNSVPAYKNKYLPQDSMLRRHFITHLRTMITELSQTCPTDSMLRRHYHTHITTQVEQCLNDEQAIQQLISCYENHKKTLTCSAQKMQVITSSSSDIKTATPVATTCEASKIPEDSMLKRHYLTNLYAQIADNLPVRPTDSTLRRHYDTMLENEVKQHLCS